MQRNNYKTSQEETRMKKCVGIYTGPKEEDHIDCTNDAEEGSVWCKKCKDIFLGRFLNSIDKMSKDSIGDKK